jgi:hypothetical protein
MKICPPHLEDRGPPSQATTTSQGTTLSPNKLPQHPWNGNLIIWTHSQMVVVSIAGLCPPNEHLEQLRILLGIITDRMFLKLRQVRLW